MIFWYNDVSKYDKKCEVYGHFSNMTFRFGLDFLHGLNFDKDIKGCGHQG